jgi:hypothetical protein
MIDIPNLYLPPEIMTDDRLTLRQIRVLMAIFSWRKANTNLARISRQMIADRTGYPLSRVSTITTELENLGWVKKTGNGGKGQWTEYRVKELKNFKKTKVSNGTQNSNGTQFGNGYQNSNETVTNSVTQTVTNSVRGIDTAVNTGRVQVEKTNKVLPKTITKHKGVDLSKFNNDKKQIAIKLIDYRKEIKKPLKTTKGLSGVINDIDTVSTKYNMSFEQVMEVIMKNEWQTIKCDYTFDKPAEADQWSHAL